MRMDHRFLGVVLVVAGAAALPSSAAPPNPASSQPAASQPADQVLVRMSTSLGDIYIDLNPEKAPVTVANFLQYVDGGFYDNLVFHRVIKGFMMQGGGYDQDMNPKKPTQPPIKNEWQNGLKNKRWTIAMARAQGQPDSATSQFFINLVDNQTLDTPRDGAGYAVFGRVMKGLDVLDKIADVPVTIDRRADPTKAALPTVPVVISTVSRADPAELKAEAVAIRAQESAEAKKTAEIAAKEAEAMKTVMETGKQFVKSQGVDITRGQATSSGLWYLDVTPGTGAQPTPSDTVEVHYTGWLPNGTKFDSSVDRGQPGKFPLNALIKGWTEGVGSMKVGGKRFLVIPPSLGYGARGAPPKIPPNSVLVFQVELLGIK